MTTNRSLSIVAMEIAKHWKPMNNAAKPYVSAMLQLDSIHDIYGMDTGRSIVNYFLANAGTWRGETARRIKAELKAMLKEKDIMP